MSRVIALPVGLVILFSLLAGVTISSARQQPVPDNIAVLHLTDCALPCWIGIVPGLTTQAEAVDDIYRAYKPSEGYEVTATAHAAMIHRWEDGQLQNFMLIEWSLIDNDVIKELGIGFFNPDIRAGELHDVLGMPQATAFLNGSAGSFRAAGYVWLYPQMLVYFHAPDYDFVNVNTISSGLTLYADHQTLQHDGYICVNPKLWDGFGVAFDRTIYYMCR